MKKKSIGLLSMVLATELLISGGNISAPTETNVGNTNVFTGADITAPVFTKVKYKYVPRLITVDDGNIHGYVRMHHIFDGEENGFDPVTGSTLGFGAEIIKGLKVGAEIYGVMDSGLTDTD